MFLVHHWLQIPDVQFLVRPHRSYMLLRYSLSPKHLVSKTLTLVFAGQSHGEWNQSWSCLGKETQAHGRIPRFNDPDTCTYCSPPGLGEDNLRPALPQAKP